MSMTICKRVMMRLKMTFSWDRNALWFINFEITAVFACMESPISKISSFRICSNPNILTDLFLTKGETFVTVFQNVKPVTETSKLVDPMHNNTLFNTLFPKIKMRKDKEKGGWVSFLEWYQLVLTFWSAVPRFMFQAKNSSGISIFYLSNFL